MKKLLLMMIFLEIILQPTVFVNQFFFLISHLYITVFLFQFVRQLSLVDCVYKDLFQILQIAEILLKSLLIHYVEFKRIKRHEAQENFKTKLNDLMKQSKQLWLEAHEVGNVQAIKLVIASWYVCAFIIRKIIIIHHKLFLCMLTMTNQ